MYILKLAIAVNFGLPWYNWYHRPKKPQLKLHGVVSYNFTVKIYKKYRIAGKSLITVC